MSLKLYGSVASPFVRRIRSQLQDQDYEFIQINIFDHQDREKLKKVSPHLRIPILVDAEKVLWDSTIIAEYLQNEPIPTDEKLNINLVNEMTDSGLLLFQIKKFKLDPQEESTLLSLQQSRISNLLRYLEYQIEKLDERTKEWLFISLDWFEFRNVVDWKSNHPGIASFYEAFPQSKWLKKTDPRIS